MISYYLIICRSLTYAQRTASLLGRVGVRASIQKAPSSIALEGCSHAVRIREEDLTRSLTALRRGELTPTRVFLFRQGMGYEEVAMA